MCRIRFRTVGFAMLVCATLILPIAGGGCSGPSSGTTSKPNDGIHYIEMDENGKLKIPDDVKTLVQGAKTDGTTDVFILAHGWNTSSTDAVSLYERARDRFKEASERPDAQRPTKYKPLVIGLIWPSKAWDFGPDVEAAGPIIPLSADGIAALDESFPTTTAVTAAERTTDLNTIKQLAQKKKADTTADDREGALALFQKYSISPAKIRFPSPDDTNRFDSPVAEGAVSPIPEGAFPTIGDAARVFTFWQMKKRAGIVGENGGAQIVNQLVSGNPSYRVHLLGHSFGCKVVLSTLRSLSQLNPDGKVDTVVLLEGAVSFQSFSDQVTGSPPSTPGGYRDVPKAVRGPIVATFSKNDQPCGIAYPLGAQIGGQTGATEAVVNPYRALGAVGIDNLNPIAMNNVGTAYGFLGESKLYSISGSDFIPSHTEILNPAVAWMEWEAVIRK